MKTFITYTLIILTVFAIYLFKPVNFNEHTNFELMDADLLYVEDTSITSNTTNLTKYLINKYQLKDYIQSSIEVPYTQPITNTSPGIFSRNYSFKRYNLLYASPTIKTDIYLFTNSLDEYFVLYSYEVPRNLINATYYIDIATTPTNSHLIINASSIKFGNKNYLYNYDALSYQENMFLNTRTYKHASHHKVNFEGALLYKITDLDPNYYQANMTIFEPYNTTKTLILGMNSFSSSSQLKFIPKTQSLIFMEDQS